jgi:hypothetical protein
MTVTCQNLQVREKDSLRQQSLNGISAWPDSTTGAYNAGTNDCHVSATKQSAKGSEGNTKNNRSAGIPKAVSQIAFCRQGPDSLSNRALFFSSTKLAFRGVVGGS